MSMLIFILSLINLFLCILFVVLQIPRFTEATRLMKNNWMSAGEYFLEASKLIAYVGGTVIYLILPCRENCFASVRKNFRIKFTISSILLIIMSFIDGSTRRLYHYVLFSFFNVCFSIYAWNTILKKSEEEENRRRMNSQIIELPPGFI